VAAPRAGAPRATEVAAIAAANADDVRLTGESASLRALQREAKAGPPPMDMAKIDALRAALAAGTYRVNPQDIAERLDALERELRL
jgi:negative regulator of flagellin synthesis FlgM